MDLKHYLVILRRWGWIMLLCMGLASVASYVFSSQQPKVYEARARYLVGPAVDNPNVSSNDLRASSQVGQTYAELATSGPIIKSALDKLNIQADPKDMSGNINATWIDASQILNIRVRTATPETAASIANAIGDALIERSPGGPLSVQVQRRQEAMNRIAQLQESIRSTEAEIDQLTNQIQQTTDQIAQRALIVRLDQRNAQLAAAQRALTDQYTIVQSGSTNQITVVDLATPNPVPIAPDVRRNVLAALLAGLVLGLAAMLLFEYFTDVIYSPDELRKASGLPYLGGIARRKRLRGDSVAQLVVHARPDTPSTESYRVLRTNLHMIGADPHQVTLLITSPARGDGKSEIAANLAVSLAQAGKQVILIDANLRRPRLAALFGLPNDRGLSNLSDQPRPTLQPLPIAALPGLSVLPAGAPAMNSSEIVGSQRMYQLLQELKAQADIIIIDSPPLLYSDALALALLVDEVLVVTNSGTTGREDTTKAVENLRLVGAHVVGAVLNRVKAGPAYFYYRPGTPQRRGWMLGAAPRLSLPRRGRQELVDMVAVVPQEIDAADAGPAEDDRANEPAADPSEVGTLDSEVGTLDGAALVELEAGGAERVTPRGEGDASRAGEEPNGRGRSSRRLRGRG